MMKDNFPWVSCISGCFAETPTALLFGTIFFFLIWTISSRMFISTVFGTENNYLPPEQKADLLIVQCIEDNVSLCSIELRILQGLCKPTDFMGSTPGGLGEPEEPLPQTWGTCFLLKHEQWSPLSLTRNSCVFCSIPDTVVAKSLAGVKSQTLYFVGGSAISPLNTKNRQKVLFINGITNEGTKKCLSAQE